MKKEIKEMEHIAAQEHFPECKKCQGFVDDAIEKALQQERERIIEIIKNQKRDEYGGCYECGNEMYNQAIEDIIENLNQ